ncbi:2-oxo-4-hydroxy-4-carboxy-5-ureidoimidazoline decarboxylase [Salinicola sp. LHM]|uniref:2-oxo-4-hydroxy-4-carboxy-5-ureidoimidazoline decarboxylase n=1 Tax=Salinicola sp. LHM TaxID=3065298 RepID=UPI002ACE1B75|nr:2-oxo-4-hydroxy-4-carboxy-5-ureidoimidazoline decarboxylase [Salinicola sp. LHM]WQH32939.1 2-oxo-4-hydroxy-4-carboxy-5-ureidoimidazoline decarboxylase [Salinicola sp. LHM]
MTTMLLSPRPSQLDRDAFIASYGEIYEHSPWIAAQSWDTGLGEAQDTPAGLAERLRQQVDAASPEAQLALIRAHPDLAGKAAVAGELTDDSRSEQAGAGLDQCTPAEFARFEKLNQAYRERFEFPFVIAVRGLDRHAILAAFETRLNHTPEEERRTAIEQIHRIALLRLEQRTTESRSR